MDWEQGQTTLHSWSPFVGHGAKRIESQDKEKHKDFPVLIELAGDWIKVSEELNGWNEA